MLDSLFPVQQSNKMAAAWLSFDECKAIFKQYFKFENVVSIQ